MNLSREEEKVAYANLTEMDKELPYQLVGVGCDFHQHPIDRPFGYPTYQWIQTYEGCGILSLEGEDLRVPLDSGMLLYPGVPHEYKETDETWYVNWVTFSGYHIERMLHKLGFRQDRSFRGFRSGPAEQPYAESLPADQAEFASFGNGRVGAHLSAALRSAP